MPHDAKRQALKAGDTVILKAKVIEVYAGEDVTDTIISTYLAGDMSDGVRHWLVGEYLCGHHWSCGCPQCFVRALFVFFVWSGVSGSVLRSTSDLAC